MFGAAAVGAGDARCCYWYRSASSLVVTSAPGQSVSYSFAQSSTDWFCSLSCPPVASLIFLAVCGAALLVLICILYFVVLDLSFVAGIFRTLFFTAAVTCCVCCVSVLFPNFCTCSLLAVAVVVWVVRRCSYFCCT